MANLTKKNLIFLLVALVLGAGLSFGVNTLEAGLEQYFYTRQIDSELTTAQLISDQPAEKNVEPEKFGVDINAKSAISVWTDLKGKRKVLFKKNSNKPLPIASLSKLMTAVVVTDLEQSYRPHDLITITREAVQKNGISAGGGLRPGAEMNVDNLLAMTLIESSNDAAFALAAPASKEGFARLMNFYAKELEMDKTEYYSPTGLSTENHPDNHSSVRDLVKLSEYILKKHPKIFEISSQENYPVITPYGTVHHYIEDNTNELVGKVPNLIGGKTGYTDSAQECLLTVLKNKQGPGYFINVILGSNNRFKEMKKIINKENNHVSN